MNWRIVGLDIAMLKVRFGDAIYGEQGADTLFGHDGGDFLDGGPGSDQINAGFQSPLSKTSLPSADSDADAYLVSGSAPSGSIDPADCVLYNSLGANDFADLSLHQCGP